MHSILLNRRDKMTVFAGGCHLQWGVGLKNRVTGVIGVTNFFNLMNLLSFSSVTHRCVLSWLGCYKWRTVLHAYARLGKTVCREQLNYRCLLLVREALVADPLENLRKLGTEVWPIITWPSAVGATCKCDPALLSFAGKTAACSRGYRHPRKICSVGASRANQRALPASRHHRDYSSPCLFASQFFNRDFYDY